jgi:hypothetical protein
MTPYHPVHNNHAECTATARLKDKMQQFTSAVVQSLPSNSLTISVAWVQNLPI